MPSPLLPEDIFHFRWIDHVRLSRDGEHVAYQLVWADAEARGNRSRLVVRRVLEPEPVEATAGARRDHSPEWSPDGRRLAFVSRRGAADQVFVLPLPGSEPVQVTSMADGASSPVWSADGTHIAFIGTVLTEPEGVVDDPRPPEGGESVRRSPVARIARRLDYKHDGPGFVDGRHQHAFVVSASGGEATQLTNGPWDVGGLDWSPDGTRVAVIGNADPDGDLSREMHLYAVDFGGSMEKIVSGWDITSPTWSPRGDLIAYIANAADEGGLLERLFVVPANGGEPRCLTSSLDIAVGDSLITDMRAGHGVPIRWSSDGERIYFPASGPGATGIYSVDLEGNVRAEVGGERRIFDFDVAGGVIAFCASDVNDPGELHVLMQGAEARLTDLNPWLRDRYIAQPDEHSFTAPDGWVLQGWLLKPPGFDPGRAYPLVMEVHGGPHGQYGWAFFHELQVLAGMGYLVFFMNPRGSDGYGEVFRRAVVRDWGGKDYLDLMSSLDQLIERIGVVDTTRVGIGGGSYGGFMTNWVIGQTNRFAAAVAMRPISNLVSEYAQHDIVMWGQLELGPPPWPTPDELWERSPIRYVQQIKTPLLLTCGEMDLRCAISQSEEMFGAMRLLGKTVEMVRFPEETHDLSRIGRPDRRVERLRRIAAWYEKYLGTQTAEKVAVVASPAEAPPEVEPAIEPEPEPALGEPVPIDRVAMEPAPPELEAPAALELEAPAALELEAPAEAVAAEPVAEVAAEPLLEPAPEMATETVPPEPSATVAETIPPEFTAGTALEAAPQPVPDMDATQTLSVAGLVAGSDVADADVAETVPPEPAPTAAKTIPPDPTATMQVDYQAVQEPAEPEPPEVEAASSQPVAPTETVPSWGHSAVAVPAPTWDEPSSAPVEPTWDQAPAAETGAPTWDSPSEAEPAAEAAPEPVAPTQPPAPQPVAPPLPPAPTVPPAGLASTIVAWPSPQQQAAAEPANGSQFGDQSGTEATSIMPAWQPPPQTATRETLALHAVPVEAGAEEPAAKLTFETGPFAGRVAGIAGESAMVGRAPDNDVVVGDPATSGRHCRVEIRLGVYWVSDLGSTNGTLVNGEPIIDKQLDDGDVISIGQNTIRFSIRQ